MKEISMSPTGVKLIKTLVVLMSAVLVIGFIFLAWGLWHKSKLLGTTKPIQTQAAAPPQFYDQSLPAWHGQIMIETGEEIMSIDIENGVILTRLRSPSKMQRILLHSIHTGLLIGQIQITAQSDIINQEDIK